MSAEPAEPHAESYEDPSFDRLPSRWWGVFFLGVNLSGVSAATGANDAQDGAYRQINVYSEVLRHIQTDYVVDPNITAVTNGALRGLLESLDANSSYLTPGGLQAV